MNDCAIIPAWADVAGGPSGGGRPIIVVMGVAGSGKSRIGGSLAARNGWDFLEGDDLHPPENVDLMARGVALKDSDRQEWLSLIAERIRASDRSGKGLVVSCSALKRSYRRKLTEASAKVSFIHLHGDRSLIEERMRARAAHFMPITLIDSQFAALEPLENDECGAAVPIDGSTEAVVAAAENFIAARHGLSARMD